MWRCLILTCLLCYFSLCFSVSLHQKNNEEHSELWRETKLETRKRRKAQETDPSVKKTKNKKTKQIPKPHGSWGGRDNCDRRPRQPLFSPHQSSLHRGPFCPPAPSLHSKQSAAVSPYPLDGVRRHGSASSVAVIGNPRSRDGVQRGGVEALLHAQRVGLHFHAVGQEGGVSIAVGHQQFQLGDPALADDAAGVGAHVGGDGIHLALLEARCEVLTVDWGKLQEIKERTKRILVQRWKGYNFWFHFQSCGLALWEL